ncbi:MAG TPA: metallophosphoesterase, partial [Nitrososphaeraceae archaeon]|nr:metallophosphoesterase [Nitrososphaeraceae archaeon]
MIAHLQNIHSKLLFSVVSLFLLAVVTYALPFFQEVIAASETHIVAVGDWGCSKNTEKIVQNVKSMNPQLLLALGDLSYDKIATCWFDIIKPVQSITKINFGNHETESESMLNSYLDHFGLSKQFYSFDINNVHVLTMASEEEPKSGSDQYNFVLNDLRKAANNPDIKWIIVSLHRPIYTSPSASAPSTSFRDPYHPLFDQYGVDLVLQGHNHNYQRTFPLNYNPSKPSDPIVTSTNSNDYKNPNGAIFTIVGTGGVNLHSVSGKTSFTAYQQDSKFGILNMHFSDNKLNGEFFTNEGAILDHFSISKTIKEKIIERISDNIVTDTKAKPLSDKEEEDKPSITYEFSAYAATDTDTKAKVVSDEEDSKAKPLLPLLDKEDIKAKPLSDKEVTKADTKAKVVSDEEGTKAKPLLPLLDKEDTKANPLSDKEEEGKPSITYKLSDDAATDTDTEVKVVSDEEGTKAKPLLDKEDSKAKPLLDKEVTKADTKAKVVSDEEGTKAKPLLDKEVTKAKPLSDKEVTKAKPLSDKEDTKAKPLLDKEEEDKPSITYKLSDDAATDTDTEVKVVSDEESTKAKPLLDEEGTKAKPLLDKEDSKAKPLSDKEVTKADTKAKVVSDEEGTKAKPLLPLLDKEDTKGDNKAKSVSDK